MQDAGTDGPPDLEGIDEATKSEMRKEVFKRMTNKLWVHVQSVSPAWDVVRELEALL